MEIAIASAAIESMLAHAARDHPREACGIVFGNDTIEAVEPARNIANNPERGFEIEPAALLRAHREARGAGRAVLGWYHSHPNGSAQPSATDAARAVDDGKLWLVVAGGRVTAWRVADGGAVHGRFTAVDLSVLDPVAA